MVKGVSPDTLTLVELSKRAAKVNDIEGHITTAITTFISTFINQLEILRSINCIRISSQSKEIAGAVPVQEYRSAHVA